MEQASKDVEKELDPIIDGNHLLYIQSSLKGIIDRTGLILGVSDIHSTVEKLGPAQTVMGKPIVRPHHIKREDTEPDKTAVQILQDRVNEAYPKVMDTDNKELAKWDEPVLRGIAIKAGMKKEDVAEAKINQEFVRNLKLAITEHEDIKAKKKAFKEKEEAEKKEG